MASTAEATLPRAQPDVSLVLDLDGVIQEAAISSAVPDEDLRGWIGRPWAQTVVDPGSRKVERMVDDARINGVSSFRQVNQRFPSGLELPIEYTTVRFGERGLIAVGKSLKAVAELQSRLVAAQMAMERDYWRLREVETRCHLLFNGSNEATLVLRSEGLSIREANPAALRALGLASRSPEALAGRPLLREIAQSEHAAFMAMLQRVREQGKAPGILVKLGDAGQVWFVQASALSSQEGLDFLLQLTPAGPSQELARARHSAEELLERAPDGFVIVDGSGIILRANQAFVELVQLGHESAVLGEPLGRWLGHPGADTQVLLANVVRHGVVRLFSTRLQGEHGLETEVEIAAAGDEDHSPRCFGMLVRDVTSRLAAPAEGTSLRAALGAFADRIGKTPLPELVKEAVSVVERHYIQSALERTAGNRTAAAQLLGLSRQSLYAKLNRYELEADLRPSASEPH